MENANPPLPFGYSPVKSGQLAAVVTCLEMLAKPALRPNPPGTALRVERWIDSSLDDYRSLYRAVGEDWLWTSRLVMPDAELKAIVSDPNVEIFALVDGERRVGLLELDFRKQDECELAFFGVVADAIGQGAGRILMNAGLDHAWRQPIKRLWVHTCNFDHPAALTFYQRSGFRPYAFMVEVFDDPRLLGRLGREAAPHVPLIDVR